MHKRKDGATMSTHITIFKHNFLLSTLEGCVPRFFKSPPCGRFHRNKHFRIFVPSRCSSNCFRRWWHSRLWAAWIVRRNAPNGRSRLERRDSPPRYLRKLAVMPSPLVCLTANDADSAVRKITLKSPNKPQIKHF